MKLKGHLTQRLQHRPPPLTRHLLIDRDLRIPMQFLRADGFSLEVLFHWGVQVDGQERSLALLWQLLEAKRVRRAQYTLPLADADLAALRHRSAYLQNVLAHDADDPFWAPLDHRHRVAEVTVPASLVGGWFDVFLPGQIRDFTALRAAGRVARLTVGPWPHADFLNVGGAAARETLDFALPYARGERPPDRAPVRLYVMGDEAWRDFGDWPPPGYPARRLHLQPGGGLATDPPAQSAPDGYRYDPADPTPAVGGVRLAPGIKAGRVDNTALDARDDVLTYTTAVLDQDAEVIGEISAEIWFRSSLPYADVFVRLCDVDADGRSTNVCDGLTSLTRRRRDQSRHRYAVADRVPPQARPPYPDPGLQRRLPPVQPQLRHRGTSSHRHHATGRAARGLPRPGRPSAVILPLRDGEQHR